MSPEHQDLIRVPPFGFVRLVDVMGDDFSIVQAARVSYGKGTKSFREDVALIDYLMRHEHWSPFEMVEFKFHVRAPIFVARQWFRHRTASVNEISGRYSVYEEEFYLPEIEDWRSSGGRNKQGSLDEKPGGFSTEDHEAVKKHLNISYQLYRLLLERGVAREQARTVLPLSLYTEFYWKQDLRNLLHFIRLRSAPEAQKEIREYALALARFVKEKTPVAWSSFEEHHLKGVRLSRTELEALADLVNIEDFKKKLEERGLSGSRIKEALDKLRLK